MKKVLFLILFVAGCLGIGRAWYWATDGFRLSRIEGFEGKGRERPFSEEAESALTQRYIYLGRGRQCFAFRSEDGKYVIKFPRLDRYKERLWFRLDIFDLLKDSIKRKRDNHVTRKEKLFDSFEISGDELLDETAIVAMFNAPPNRRTVEIVDRLGRSFQLPLEKTGFILQRKLRLFREVFGEALAKKDMAEIDRVLDRLLALIVRIADKGILSKDGSFINNFAFNESRCFQIDIGSFYRSKNMGPEEAFISSIHASIETLRAWLLYLDPSLLSLLDSKLVPIYERCNES